MEYAHVAMQANSKCIQAIAFWTNRNGWWNLLRILEGFRSPKFEAQKKNCIDSHWFELSLYWAYVSRFIQHAVQLPLYKSPSCPAHFANSTKSLCQFHIAFFIQHCTFSTYTTFCHSDKKIIKSVPVSLTLIIFHGYTLIKNIFMSCTPKYVWWHTHHEQYQHIKILTPWKKFSSRIEPYLQTKRNLIVTIRYQIWKKFKFSSKGSSPWQIID